MRRRAPEPTPAQVASSARVQHDLERVLRTYFADVPAMEVLAAMTYEVGRIAGLAFRDSGCSGAERAAAVRTILDTLRQQIDLHADGEDEP